MAEGKKAERLYYLDWLRFLMIVLVVYAHVELTIGPLGKVDEDGNVAQWVIDDHARGLPNSKAVFSTRWVSFCRPWCLPLLFWISGAALAFGKTSFAVRKSAPKLVTISVIGMLLNFAIWELGPANPDCSPFTPCKGDGILFDFSICALSGKLFPIVFQMWYPLVLMVYLIWNWALLKSLDSGSEKFWLKLQSIISCAMCVATATFTPNPIPTAIWLCCCEIVFHILLLLTFKQYRPTGIPLRAVQYGLGLVTVMEFGATEFAHEITGLSTGFAAFSAIGFKQFFVLGLSMMRCKSKEEIFGEAGALASSYWPLLLVGTAIVSPSSNYIRGGNLTYPFFPHAVDRCLYVGCGVVVIFIVDRIGRSQTDIKCGPLSDALNNAGLLLYLLHPTLMQVILQLDPTISVPKLWLLILAIILTPALLIDLKNSRKKENPKLPMSEPVIEPGPSFQSLPDGPDPRKSGVAKSGSGSSIACVTRDDTASCVCF